MTTAVLVALALVLVVPWAPASGRLPVRERSARRRSDRVRTPAGVDVAVLLDLADAALVSGASVPAALVALGEVVAGEDGRALRRAGSALSLGAGWSEAWNGTPTAFTALAGALEPAWVDGMPAGPLLRQAADRIRADRSRDAHEAAARLGVRLVLPLGLCFLPAFVLLGLVPVLLSAGAWLRP